MGVVYFDASADVTPRMFGRASYRVYWWTVGRWLTFLGVIGVIYSLIAISQNLPGWVLGLALFMVVIGLVGGPGFGLPRLFGEGNALANGRFRFLANDEGVVVETPFGHQQLKWTAYRKAYLDGNFVYLVITERAVQCIPLAIASDPAALTSHLRELGLLQSTPRNFFVV